MSVAGVLRDVVQSCALEAEARQCRLVVNDSLNAARSMATLSCCAAPSRTSCATPSAMRRRRPRSTCARKTAPSGLVVTVRDAGTGVPDDLLPRLAQPFFRVEDARDYSPSGGVGLGLSIAHRAVQLHHGTLVAENAHPGLRVRLTFPDGAALAPS